MTARNRDYYVYGNTARQLDVRTAVKEKPKKRITNANRKNRDKAVHMNPGYVLFLCGALLVTCLVLVNYIQLQSDITNSVKYISSLESELNELRMENDDEYSRVTSSVDLEEVKRIAIGELGMKYAEEGQIIEYTSQSNDYVRQLADIPTR